MEATRGFLILGILLTGAWVISILGGYAYVFKYVFLRAHKEGTNCPSCLYEFVVHAGWRLVLQAGTPICILVWLLLLRAGIFPASLNGVIYAFASCLVGLMLGASVTRWNMSKRIEAAENAPSIRLRVPEEKEKVQ